MNNFDRYLDELRSKLKGFDEAEQNEILEEIGSHIEAGMDDGRFTSQSSDLMEEMGPPTELAHKLRTAHNRPRWVEALLILIPFLVVEFGWSVIYQLKNTIGIGMSQVAFMKVVTVFGYGFLLTIIGMIAVGWQRRSLVIRLWWVSKGLAIALIPRLIDPLLIVGTPFPDFSGVASIVYWVLLVIFLLYWGLTAWQSRHDGLVVSFGILPLTLFVTVNGLSVIMLNNSLPREMMLRVGGVELVTRLLMLIALPVAYFMFRQQWQRWLGMGTAVYLYLFIVTYLVLDLPRSPLFGVAYYLVAIWTVVIFTFGVGLLLDRSSVTMPHRGLPA